MKELGKFEKVELREVWENEPEDFSPWVVDNIGELAKAINVDFDSIKIEETETRVGKYWADITGKFNNGTETANIVIENQLTKSDHDHLGKIITYASGLDAKLVIWICKDAEDEHRAAVDWLNKNTKGDVSFFLIKIGLWKIDDSKPAARFEVVCQPNEWEKAIQKSPSQSTETTGTRLAQLDFWQEFQIFLEDKSEAFKRVFKYKIPAAMGYNWYSFHFSPGKAFVGCVVSFAKDTIRCDLYIETKERYARLFQKKDEINKALGLELEWDEALLEKNQQANRVQYQNNDIKPSENFTACFEWFYETTVKYLTIMPQFLKELETKEGEE